MKLHRKVGKELITCYTDIMSKYSINYNQDTARGVHGGAGVAPVMGFQLDLALGVVGNPTKVCQGYRVTRVRGLGAKKQGQPKVFLIICSYGVKVLVPSKIGHMD